MNNYMYIYYCNSMGMSHDYDVGCGTNEGIMGYRKYNWSSCSAYNFNFFMGYSTIFFYFFWYALNRLAPMVELSCNGYSLMSAVYIVRIGNQD